VGGSPSHERFSEAGTSRTINESTAKHSRIH
jgi:hypothetical protein